MFLIIIKASRFVKNNDLVLEVETALELKQLMSLMIHDYHYVIVDDELNLSTGVRTLVFDYLDDVDEREILSKTRIKNNFDKYRRCLVRKNDLAYTHIKLLTEDTDNLDQVLIDIDEYVKSIKEFDGTKIFYTGYDIYDANSKNNTCRIDIIQFGTIFSTNSILMGICNIMNANNIELLSLEIC